MGVSLAFVACLAGWCYYKVLAFHDEPPEPVKDFHSA